MTITQTKTTTTTIAFPAPVRDWIVHNLSRGVTGPAIVEALIAQGSNSTVAQRMVMTVSDALLHCAPLPGPELDLAAPPLTYVPRGLHVKDQTVIDVGDRQVRVLMTLHRPQAILVDQFLDHHECESLIRAAGPRLNRSSVVDPVTGRDVVAGHRSSDGMFFRLGETTLIERIEARIDRLTGFPVENGEGLQLLHYEQGAESTPHYDYLMPNSDQNRESVARSGQRVSTLLMYLNDVPSGGHTVFPHCGLSVAPKRGQALYFEYGSASGLCDPMSLHAATPVRSGDKWVATKWIREHKFVARGAR